MIFPPYKVKFHDLGNHNDPRKILDFKNCSLNKVYFENCDFGKISIYSSEFINSQFLNCTWHVDKVLDKDELNVNNRDSGLLKFRIPKIKLLPRKNRIYDDITNHEKDKISSLEVSNLYAQLKSSFDLDKKFQDSNEFYINEREAFRKHLLYAGSYGKYIIHSLYWILTGYTGRPLRSFLSSTLLVVIFAFYNLFNGLDYFRSGSLIRSINYNFDLDSKTFIFYPTFWNDLLDCFYHALLMIIPLGYLKSANFYSLPQHIDNSLILVQLIYSLIVLSLLSSTLIGLKREFKRF